MKLHPASCAVVIALAALPSPTRAVIATGLSSFEAIEEPLVRYQPVSERFARDTFVNITDVGNGTFRFTTRFNADEWDGDRDTENKDRQRAEVKGLGPHQKDDDTFVYATTWRANPGFRHSGFCHIFQLKATNGDSGLPLITLSIRGDKAVVEATPIGPKFVAREFPWKPNTWQTVRIHVKTTPLLTGEVLVSVDGDEFQGKVGVVVARPGANEYRPKWGLYRRAAANAAMGDDFVEHRDLISQNILWTGSDNGPLERQARALAKKTSPREALEWLLTQPDSPARDIALATIAALWAETHPADAIAWSERHLSAPARLDALRRSFARWLDHDVDAATKWLRGRAPRPELDEIAWLFATDTTYRYVAREHALDAVALISDVDLRTTAYLHVADIWARTDPGAARAFVAKSADLPGAHKDLVLSKLPMPNARPAPAGVGSGTTISPSFQVAPGTDSARR